MPTQTLADYLYGPIQNADTHAELYGSAAGGYVIDTTGGGQATADPQAQAQALASAGTGKILGPSGPIFWLVAFVVGFLVINGFIRK